VDTDAVLALLVEVAEEVIDPRFRSLSSAEVDEKNPGDLVTVADREAEELITRRLREAHPDAVVLGEEASADDPGLVAAFRSAEHAFCIDPVDGTKNFVHGSPDHAVMVAETRGGETVRAWIWQPQHRRAYVAERGAGAWCNGRRLHRSTPEGGPTTWRVVTNRRPWLGRRVGPTPPLALAWVSCGIDYPKLAEGEADAVLYTRPNPWDHAPGGLIVAEAGGALGTFEGVPYRPADAYAGHQGLLAAGSEDTFHTLLPHLREL
jgi:fructose-1,6-bisphosphatase/inositol monophosphatase family enzyme